MKKTLLDHHATSIRCNLRNINETIRNTDLPFEKKIDRLMYLKKQLDANYLNFCRRVDENINFLDQVERQGKHEN